MKSENREPVSVTFKRIFSIKADAADKEEIRKRLLDGGIGLRCRFCGSGAA